MRLFALALLPLACSAEPAPAGLPRGLPFELSRASKGEPLSDAEIRAFSAKITGLWRDVGYFRWILETSHGVDASTGKPDYLIWWHDVDAVKAGDTVTFKNASRHGGSHNNAEPTSLALIEAIGGHLLAKDPDAARVVEQLAKSFTATMKGFVFDANDPLPYLMTRNIVAQNHSFTLPSGKKKAVDYSEWFNTYEDWNAQRLHYPSNPTWGDVYVTNMRSKDDLPWLYRATAWFPYVLEESEDAAVRAAVEEALVHMRGFAKDIVDSGWNIRTKDANGQPYVPTEDLASFVRYTELIPEAECGARLATALIATGTPIDQDCGSGQGGAYDDFAVASHYYNYSIVDGFHMNAVHLALTSGRAAEAEALLRGLVARLDRYRDPARMEPGREDPSWERDLSVLLLQGAALGMPLTADEGREIQRFLSRAAELYAEFPRWDLWDASVPDGTYDFRSGFQPARVPEAVRVEEIALLLEYCWSPFKSELGARFVDCEIVGDRSRWGAP